MPPLCVVDTLTWQPGSLWETRPRWPPLVVEEQGRNLFFFFFLEKGKTRILTCVCLDVRRSRGGQCDWLNGLRGVGAGKQEGRGWGSLVALRAPPGALVLFCLSECIIDSTKYSVCQHRQAK